MALIVSRCGNGRIACVGAVLRRHAVECPRLIVYGSGNTIQVATLKATYGGKYPYSKPFPYEKKKFGLLESFYDKTIPRLNENSKVIVVEGNLGVGKTEFARKLATNFDMKFFPPSTDRDCFIRDEYGFDMRKLDELLPLSAQCYDLAKFYADKHPEKGWVGKLQLRWYEKKFYDYMDALKHLLSTGNAFVGCIENPESLNRYYRCFVKKSHINENAVRSKSPNPELPNRSSHRMPETVLLRKTI